MWRPPVRIDAITIAITFLSFLCAEVSQCAAQNDDVVCREGSGSFAGKIRGGINVRVSAAKNGGLSTRRCEAIIEWGDRSTMVASGVWEADLDAFGIDLGIGQPVAAFQVKESEAGCCANYLIYSLERPPRLLRTITGGSSYQASDVDLDDRVEIWTDDAAAVDGLDNLAFGELDSPPVVVLRFERNKLLDVGAEFHTQFDQVIARLKGHLDSQGLKDFKESNGRLQASASSSVDHMHNLRKAKIWILEIVWSYLYSGRESEAWNALADMWPAADLQRIHAAIVKARDNGIHSQIDGVSSAPTARRKKRAAIFDVTGVEERASGVTPPQPILLRRPPPAAPDQATPVAEMFVDLVVDAAGKVRSVEPAGSATSVDADLLDAARAWKFIPASNNGRAVASRTRLAVSAKR